MIAQDGNDSEEREYLLTAVLLLVSSATMEISIKADEIDLPRVQMYHFIHTPKRLSDCDYPPPFSPNFISTSQENNTSGECTICPYIATVTYTRRKLFYVLNFKTVKP